MISEKLKYEAEQIIQMHKGVFDLLSYDHRICMNQVMNAFVEYNSNIHVADNSIYERLDIRAAMFIEYNLDKSWHQERQQVLLEFLKSANPKSIIDVGFGAPTRYIKDLIIPASDIFLTLADKYQSAFTFTNLLFNHWKIQDDQRFIYKTIDLDKHQYLGDYDAYIFQDTIEHSIDPFRFLSLNVSKARAASCFILSLPIAPIIPCHHVSWNSVENAISWVESCGLRIIHKKQVFVNPEVDEFAQGLGKISDLMLIAKKNENT